MRAELVASQSRAGRAEQGELRRGASSLTNTFTGFQPLLPLNSNPILRVIRARHKVNNLPSLMPVEQSRMSHSDLPIGFH